MGIIYIYSSEDLQFIVNRGITNCNNPDEVLDQVDQVKGQQNRILEKLDNERISLEAELKMGTCIYVYRVTCTCK